MNPIVKISVLTGLGGCLSVFSVGAEEMLNTPPLPVSAVSDTAAPEEIAIEPTGNLLLSQALALALTKNPSLAAFSQEIRAREAAALQANLLPNPTFGVQASNFGNNRFKGADGDVITLQLSQLVELGGKRAARTELAQLNQHLAGWDYEAQRMNVLTQVTQAYITVLATQQRLLLADKLLNLAKQVVNISAVKVRSGSVPPLEETKARVIQASAQIERQRAQQQLTASRLRLANSWGSTQAIFKSVQGDLEAISPLPALDSLIQRITENPDLARWTTEMDQRQAFIALQKSNAIPDVTFNLGTNAYLDGNDYNLNAGFSIALPIFNRNQGSILAAEQRLYKAQDERRNVEINTMTELQVVYQQLDTAYREIITLRRDVIPGAESAFNAASRGYRLGEFAFLQVLDAQRTLVRVKTQYLQAQANYHLNVAKIERLIGGALNPTSANKIGAIQ